MPPKKRSGLSRKTATAKHMALTRQSESDEDRARRLSSNRARIAATRMEESEDDRARRLEGNQIRMAASRRHTDNCTLCALE